ncbi:hypothetical protein N7509_006243 [Penicillium cosmopolitanum]|uniref:Uncharacterized protein n=1 Tax=Penicillium cosmopolitanum TaxID=1131564 RepID=A0A9X0BAT8_9EURO|nr:uncharacterized protein N7509_006243 [Penicillium cosmopolitanum]KAJ5398130.1 hypothetical protein N7509_006243 [Penicillium cosmopolitanum]
MQTIRLMTDHAPDYSYDVEGLWRVRRVRVRVNWNAGRLNSRVRRLFESFQPLAITTESLLSNDHLNPTPPFQTRGNGRYQCPCVSTDFYPLPNYAQQSLFCSE